VQANFHDASDEADWYFINVVNPKPSALAYGIADEYLTTFACYPYWWAIEVALTGITSGADYELSLSSYGMHVSDPPLPLSVSGNQNIRIPVKFQTNNCGSSEELSISVRRGEGVTVNEGYTLAIRSYQIPPGPASITDISPTSGQAGTTITITGNNIGLGSVRFTGADKYCKTIIPPTTDSPTSITTTVPACVKTGPIYVLTEWGGGQTPGSQIFTVTSETPAPPSKKGGISPASPDKKQPPSVKPGTTHAPSSKVPAAKAPKKRKDPKSNCIGLGCGEDEPTCIGMGCGETAPICVGMGCEKKGATVPNESGPTGAAKLPPVQKPTIYGQEPCCSVVANAALKGRLGRVVVAFPDGAVPKSTRVDVLKDGKVLQSGYGNKSWGLLSGTYEVSISGKQVPNVTVKAGHDTMVKVGVLRVSAAKGSSVDVLDGGHKLTSGYGDQIIGLPPGAFDLKVAGQTQPVTISEGQVTDF